MDPHEILELVTSRFPGLVAKPRRNPDGWAFYAARSRDQKLVRVFRAVRSSPSSVTKLKLAISSRLRQEPVIIDFKEGEARLISLVQQELRELEIL